MIASAAPADFGRKRGKGPVAAFAIAVAAGLISALLATPAFATESDLIDATPAETAVVAPPPGGTESWQLEVRNVSSQRVPLTLDIAGQSDRLYSGETPLQLEIVDSSGVVILSQSTTEALGSTIELDGLDAGDTRRYTARVSLPAEADNAYQGASGVLELRFVAQGDDTSSASSGSTATLARTGGDGLRLLGLFTASAFAIAIGLVFTRRRKKEAR